MKRQAIILAAGTGSRLKPLTDKKPKCLLEVGEKTLLERQLGAVKNSRLDSVTIVTGHLHEQIALFVETRFAGDWIRLVRNDAYQTTNNAYSLGLALKEKTGPFILLDGDLLFDPELLGNLTRANGGNLFVVDSRLNRLTDEAMKVSVNKAGRITHFSKKMPTLESRGEYIGMARLGEAWAEALTAATGKMEKNMRETGYYEDLINPLIPSSPPLSILSTDNLRWTEIDTPEDLRSAQADWGEQE